jgi:twitching motility protein PilT
MDLIDLLNVCVERQASDLHLTQGEPPLLRIDGHLIRTEFRSLTSTDLQALIYAVLTDEQQVVFERDLELDFALALPDTERFRVNVHFQRGTVEAALRRVPLTIPTLDDLGLPPVAKELSRQPNGLVLVTGPTGMGKTTTLGAMVNLINKERECLIISIEDPIEIVHTNRRSIIKQREVHADTHSFASALRHVLRQDPDVIVVGEMRDLETISTTLTAAETGHLVLATLHTPDAAQTITRIIDVFPSSQQQQIALQLADCLRGVISQLLLPHASGFGRILATEVLVGTAGIRNLIREKEIEQIPSLIQTGNKHGMRMMDKSLEELYLLGLISMETLISKAKEVDSLKRSVKDAESHAESRSSLR